MQRKTAIQFLVLLMILAGFLLAPVSADEKESAVKPAKTEIGTPDQNSSPEAGVEGEPVIFFPEEEFNFGEVGQVTTLSHTFKVLNKGDAPLKLLSAKAS